MAPPSVSRPAPAQVTGPLRAVTWNCDGVLHKPKDAQRTRCAQLGKFMSQNRVSLAHVQEPHFNEQSEATHARSILQMRSLHLDSVVSADDHGGAALVYSHLWSVLDVHWLDPRFAVHCLQHGDGWKGVFCFFSLPS